MPPNHYKPLPLLSDIPAGEGIRKDELGFEHTAIVLADAAVETNEPLTIGIFGEWGTGKTSTMRLIEEKVHEKPNAVAVWFNAWQYEKEDHLIVPLTATIEQDIASQIDTKNWKGKVLKGAENLRDALRSIAYGFSIKGKVGFPLLSEAEINLSPKDMIERYQDLTKDAVLARSLYFDAFKRLKELSVNKTKLGTPPKIVVLVDDLDRCFPDKAVELLEGIKLVLHQPGFSFVIGVNDEIIQKFIKTKYEKEFNITGSYFDQYLDKIVQVKVPVPSREPESDEMENYIESLLDDEVFKDKETRSAIVLLVSHACKHNPRSIVRLLNRVMISSRISILENREYDPVALLLHIAMDEPVFNYLRTTLNSKLAQAGNQTIGMYLAKIIENYDDDDIEWFNNQIKQADELELHALKKSIETLQTNKHICKILQLESGQNWLKDKYFREKQSAASNKTMGDRKIRPFKIVNHYYAETTLEKILQDMITIHGGSFRMGSEFDSSVQPIHKVMVENFRMSVNPVTQIQYESIMQLNPSKFNGPNNPVDSVSWEDARAFCKKLSTMSDLSFRLPTEAEWEYACIAGTKSDNCIDNDEPANNAWFISNSDERTHRVGGKAPNMFHLYDLLGNVWEWCEDDWHNNYLDAPSDGSAWIDVPRSIYRVLRGGSWAIEPVGCRTRLKAKQTIRHDQFGFRLVLSIQ